MQVKCIESNSDAFIVDKVYSVKQVFGFDCDERDRVLIDEEGDPWKFLYRYDGGDVIGVRLRAKFERY
ncbi:hypothetical protein ABLC45_16855 [Escherichia coli]|uniref:hypothetical protein n=1 Tax=Escherichia coli TaxID=562 RepID=UPI001DEF4397|nr:hypothetical protein [Escherichia coli]HCB7960098.1 hypothetical protein [Escherichia coli]